MSGRPILRLALLAALLLAAGAANAQAAQPARTVPHGFFGANWSFEITSADAQTQEIAFRKMAAGGVESQRALFNWSDAQGAPGEPFDFSESDQLVELALEHNMELLPIVASAPHWARRSTAQNSPPKHPHDYAKYLQALIAHYGPNGDFWKLHPDLPKRPIRSWQIWNEPSRNYQWTIPKGEKWAPGYGKLLRVSYRAIKQADPGARVVIAGLPNRSWRALDRLYREGHVQGYFDVGAVHPYTLHDHGVLTIVRNYRQVMREHGDGKKGIRVTELGLPASKGRIDSDFALQTTDKGMTKFLRQSYQDLIANYRKLHVTRVNWFTWASLYQGQSVFDYSGLFVYHPDKQGAASMHPKPAFKVFRKLARQSEGCVKDGAGACAQQ